MSFYWTSAGKRKCSRVYFDRAVARDKANWRRWVLCVDFLKQIWTPTGAKGNIQSLSGEYWVLYMASGVANLEMLTTAESYQRLEEKLDDILTSHRRGNWELVLPFHSWFFNRASAAKFCSRHHRAEIQEKDVLIIILQSGASHGYVLTHSPVKQG